MRRLLEWKSYVPNPYKNKLSYRPSTQGARFLKKDRDSVDCLEIASGEKEIYANTFNSCANLKEVILPDGLERINAFAFAHCTKLQKINLPDSITYIADGAFDGCNSLVVSCTKGSYADQFAVSHGIKVIYTNETFAEDFETYNNLWNK